MSWLVRRLAHAFLLLFGISVLTFLFTGLAPGTYFDELRLNPQISSETFAALKAHYDLDKPLPVRYAAWFASLARGNLGYSFAYNAPVAPLLLVRARNTLFLTVTAMLLSWLVALPLGVWSAADPGRWPDRLVTSFSALLLVIPDIALALGLLALTASHSWLPSGGLVSLGFDTLPRAEQALDLLRHLLLPAATLVLIAQPLLVRHVRAAVGEALNSEFVRAAEAHGIPRARLLWRYGLTAAANPLISLLGLSIASLLSGSLLVEVIMGWPGLGPFLLEAILARDLYVVIGGVLFSTVFLVAGNLLADLLLYWADPRIRTE